MTATDKVPFLGIGVSVIDTDHLLEAVEARLAARTRAMVNNVNVHACNLAWTNPAFRRVLNDSDLVFCDGFGVKWAARLAGIRLGERMTPPDWIDRLFERCARGNYRVFLLGDEEAVVRAFAAAVRARHPGITLAGAHHGFFATPAEQDAVLRAIRESGADLIVTGMGMPRQELWAAGALPKLDKGVCLATGALFRWYTGLEHRGPRWMTRHGFEWLARLLARPGRMWSRYVLGLPLFAARVLIWKCTGRTGRS